MLTFLSRLLLILALPLQVGASKLARISSDFDKNIMNFYVETSESNNIDSLRYITTTPSGSIAENMTLLSKGYSRTGSEAGGRKL